MHGERHTGKRILLLAIIVFGTVGMVGILASEVASAQEANETVNDGSGTVEYSLDDVDLRSVEFVNGSVVIDAVFHERATIAVTDSAAVQNTGSNSGGYVPYQPYSRSAGEHRITMQLASDDEIVTVAQGGTMIVDTGDRGILQILAHSPTTPVVQTAALGGGFGMLITTGLVIGYLRRQHENNYKELLSEEKIRVEEDTVDGILGKVQSFLRRHKHLFIVALIITLYFIATRLNLAPSLTELWAAANDAQRVFAVATILMVIIGFVPVYVLISRLWEPAKEFVISFDVRDALSVSAGSKGDIEEFLDDVRNDDGEVDIDELVNGDDQIAISVYSGSPERVSKINVLEGEVNDVRSPGGRTYLARDFDPEKNVATGTWPGTAHDAIIAIAFAAIEWNRDVMEDESEGFRQLLAGLGPVRSSSNSTAAAALNKELAESTDIDPEPTNNILDRALESTRYGGYFTDDEDDEDDDDGEYEDDVEDSHSDGDGGSGGKE